MHLLVCFEKEWVPKTEADINKIACARLPDPEKFPELHALVNKYMIHQKCGKHRDPKAKKPGCMQKNNSCKHFFPKDYAPRTGRTFLLRVNQIMFLSQLL